MCWSCYYELIPNVMLVLSPVCNWWGLCLIDNVLMRLDCHLGCGLLCLQTYSLVFITRSLWLSCSVLVCYWLPTSIAAHTDLVHFTLVLVRTMCLLKDYSR